MASFKKSGNDYLNKNHKCRLCDFVFDKFYKFLVLGFHENDNNECLDYVEPNSFISIRELLPRNFDNSFKKL